MAGISAISMISHLMVNSSSQNKQKLTEATKAKLLALGVDIKGIKTEQEGQILLHQAQLERSDKISGTQSKKSNAEEVDDVLQKARQLADDLNISYTDNDTIDDLISKIEDKVEELFSQANQDETKQTNANYFSNKLDEIKKMEQSQINLGTTMNLTASMNIAFFGLY